MTESRDADFERLLREYGPALHRLARWYASGHDDLDDLLQEIAFGLWRAHRTFRAECSERTFVYRVAHNRAASWRARRGGRPEGDPTALERLVDQRASPHAVAEATDRWRELVDALRTLPESQAQVVLLKLEGLSDREISVVVGTSEGNVSVRLARARKTLRARIGGRES